MERRIDAPATLGLRMSFGVTSFLVHEAQTLPAAVGKPPMNHPQQTERATLSRRP